MSDGNWLNFSKLSVYLFAAIFLVVGAVLTYFSLVAGMDIVSPRMFTPFAIIISIVALVMLFVKVE